VALTYSCCADFIGESIEPEGELHFEYHHVVEEFEEHVILETHTNLEEHADGAMAAEGSASSDVHGEGGEKGAEEEEEAEVVEVGADRVRYPEENEDDSRDESLALVLPAQGVKTTSLQPRKDFAAMASTRGTLSCS
jgi:hypothetical protein